MKNNDNEDIKVIKFGNNNNEDQKQNIKNEVKTDNPNENNEAPVGKRSAKLKSQRTKFPKGQIKNQKKGGFSLFSCCLPSNKDDDDDD